VSERVGECRLLHRGVDRRRLAPDQERLAESRNGFELGQLLLGELRLAARDLVAVARIADGRRQQDAERQPAAFRCRGFEREHPAADGAWHGKRRKRSARRNRLVLAIEFGPCLEARRAGRHDRAHAAGRLANEPEPVAADMSHMRIDRGDGGAHRQHRLDRVAAFG
jgi:hypothetical protein